MRRAAPTLATAVLTTIATITTLATFTPADAADTPPAQSHAGRAHHLPTVSEYVALGDSWSADVVIANADGLPDTTYTPVDCAQSQRNYPKLVAAALGVRRFADATCGSATTDDFTAPQSLPLGGQNPPQLDRLSRRTKLVTVGIGGNDAGIASAGLSCLNALPVPNPLPAGTLPPLPIELPLLGDQLPLGSCKDRLTAGGHDQLSQQIRRSRPKLVRAFRAIHRIAPRARILAVDYLAIVPDHGCYPVVPASDEDMAYIHDKFIELNAMVRRAARRGGAEFVDTFSRTGGHDLCQGPLTRWGETYGLSLNDPAVGVPAHPNAAGARAQAREVLRYLKHHPRRR